MKKNIFEYAPDSNVVNDIKTFVDEYLEGE